MAQLAPVPDPSSIRRRADAHPSRSDSRAAPLRIVALGGGTGLSTLLRGLRDLSASMQAADPGSGGLDLAAIVTVTDDGGSSGRLRRDFAILAPGDIRNCMVALAEDEALLSKLFQYRFRQGRGLEGHSFGNLFLTALTEVTGDFHQAIQLSSEVLAIRGRIFPSTLMNVRLEAVMASGRSMVGETRITGSRDGIRRMRLRPRQCEPVAEALEAIEQADLITLGPGSLYTSVVPNLLVRGVTEALAASKALKIYICNLMWEPGETDGYTAGDHLQAIFDHSQAGLADAILVNNSRIAPRVLRRYADQSARPVELDRERLEQIVPRILEIDFAAKGPIVRHDSDRLAGLLVDLAVERRARSQDNGEAARDAGAAATG
ncbi:MAG: uridine diphosphate-N-acetylglucosamine-binding protein YvcK [Acidobacteria bacterium]|nr:uridine diphosphate-N-acetylglucosamine-binding protein YvcK [Acidobacteriota bacterium]